LLKILELKPVGKSACKFCPNKPMSYFVELDQREPQVIDLMIEMERNPFNATFKYGKSIKQEIRDQTSLDSFDFSELNCSEYCYT